MTMEDIASEIDVANTDPTGSEIQEAPPPIETDVDPEPEITVANVQESLQWTLSMLQDPSLQWLDCPTHGKVSITHSCTTMTNTLLDRAVYLSGATT